ncbi:MAG: hypothetical protein M1825_003530 [Sarcosagium campestre]|nr:MAG: hypothetical protein M1825_003530 [Sarcosagium campestre]
MLQRMLMSEHTYDLEYFYLRAAVEPRGFGGDGGSSDPVHLQTLSTPLPQDRLDRDHLIPLALYVDGMADDMADDDDDDDGLDSFEVWPVKGVNVKAELSPRGLPDGQMPLDKDIVQAFSRLLHKVWADKQLPERAFDGVIFDADDVIQFTFKVYGTPVGCTLELDSEKTRPVDASLLDALYATKKRILAQTTQNDLLLFVGNSAAYFHATMNLPSDDPKDVRNVQLIPFDAQLGILKPIRLDAKGAGNPYRTGALSKQNGGLWPETLDSLLRSDGIGLYTSKRLQPIFYLREDTTPKEYQIGSSTDAANANTLEGKPFGRVVLLDMLVEGNHFIGSGVGLFSQLLSKVKMWTQQKPSFINLLDRTVFPRPEDAEPIYEAHYGRILPPYPPQYWHLPLTRIKYQGSETYKLTVERIRAQKLQKIV